MTVLPLSHQRTTDNEGRACLSHLSIWLAGKEGTCMLVKEEVGWKKWGGTTVKSRVKPSWPKVSCRL
uniref:Thymosin beta 4 X-linked n=1 Tax=Pongo abelii TaxID=9601 RepID=A0A8J9ECM0_PONAB